MSAVTAAASAASALRIQDATGIPVEVQASQSFEIIATYVGSLIDTNGPHGEKMRYYLDGRVCVAKEMDENGSTSRGGITYKDGRVYLGPIVNGEPEGEGYMTHDDKGSYVGAFQSGKRNGYGEFTDANKIKFSGQFCDGYLHGLGRYVFPNGEEYLGEFQRGVRHGQGTYTHASGEVYEGEFQNNKRHGKGILTVRDGHFVVEYVDGIKVDESRIDYSKATRSHIATKGTKMEEFEIMPNYEGQKRWRYRDGRECVARVMDRYGSAALGAITFKNGSVYVGTIVNGVAHGKGCITLVNGTTKEGEFKHGHFKNYYR